MAVIDSFRSRLRYYKKRIRMRGQYLLDVWTGRTYYETEHGVKLCFLAPYHNSQARGASHGIIEPEFMGIWRLYATRSSRIYDIGGFNGIFGLTAAKTNPSAQVVIFEPDPINQKHIQKNIELNGLTNCTLERCAVSDFDGESTFSFDGTTYSMVGKGEEKIECRTLDSFPPAGLIKIDAGNSEAAAILGGKKTIAEKRPLILMQTHESAVKHDEMYSFLQSLKYHPVEFAQLPQGKHIVWDPRS